jgi:hypothetical protein
VKVKDGQTTSDVAECGKADVTDWLDLLSCR